MNGLEALRHIKKDDFPVMIASYPPIPATLGGYTKDELFSIIEKELKDGEKHKKFFEIIKSHAKENKHFRYLLYMAKYWEGNKVEVTKELLENYDFPYEVEEFNFLKEALE